MKVSCLVAAARLCGRSIALAARAGGPFGIDRTVACDGSGIWNRNVQKGVAAGGALTTLGSAQSRPSGEVAERASVMRPCILEYRHGHPAVCALALLPACDAVARVKTHGHWQSDVLAGAAVGVALGVYAHHRAKPLFLGFTPDGSGVMVGYVKAF